MDDPKETAKERAIRYLTMDKSQLNAEYDTLRASDLALDKIDEAGMAMHKAYYNKENDPSTWEYIKSDRLRSALQGAAGYEEPTPAPAPTAPSAGKVTEPSDITIASTPKAATMITEFDPTTALYYGDSIATGYGHGGAKGNENSDARWGRGAGRTLALLSSRPEGTFKGKDIVLSSGVLNSGLDLATVRQQLELLQGRGARSIRLLGAPKTGTRFAGYNDKLRTLSNELGVTFLGGYEAGDDNIHPKSYNWNY